MTSPPRRPASDALKLALLQQALLLPLAGFVMEVLTMLTNEKRRALHDFIGGTVVVRTNIEEGGAQTQPLQQPLQQFSF